MWEKIKLFFKKFWWVILIPAGLFLVHALFKRETPGLDKAIKEKTKEVIQKEKELEKTKKETKKTEEVLDREVEETKEVIQKNLDDKEERDKEATQFFPDL